MSALSRETVQIISKIRSLENSTTETDSALDDKVSGSSGPTASRPTGLTTADAGKVTYFDTTTQGWVVWTGSKWSDQ